MPSALFNPLLELAFSVARDGERAKPKVSAPARLVPLLRFTKLPNQARQTTFDVLDTDPEFRSRVLDAADELSVGRIGMAYLERPDGWEDLVEKLVGLDAEPVVPPNREIEALQLRLDDANATTERTQERVDELIGERDDLKRRLDELAVEAEAAEREVQSLRDENRDLTAQRKRAVGELKRTEEVMARHVAERKRLETQIAAMTEAQMNTSMTGGAVSDAQVRSETERLLKIADDLRRGLEELGAMATPVREPSPVRTPMPLPPGLHDDSVEAAEYLLRIPGMVVLVDGYNVSREAHDEMTIEDQRVWLESGLTGVAARTGAEFDVVFDGADVSVARTGARATNVSVRFSPDGVEADDVIIDTVRQLEMSTPVTVVSSDRRVRNGSTDGGANVLHSHQLIALL